MEDSALIDWTENRLGCEQSHRIYKENQKYQLIFHAVRSRDTFCHLADLRISSLLF